MSNTRDTGLRHPTSSSSFQKGKYYFLGIGIDRYQDHKVLHNAVNDLRAIKNVLIDKYIFEKQPLICLEDNQATRIEILKAFRTIEHTLTEHDNLLIYYAGHGTLDEQADGYLIPVEEKKGEYGHAIQFRTIKEKIANSKAKNVLLIADCCYASRIFDKTRSDNKLFASDTTTIRRIQNLKSRWVLLSFLTIVAYNWKIYPKEETITLVESSAKVDKPTLTENKQKVAPKKIEVTTIEKNNLDTTISTSPKFTNTTISPTDTYHLVAGSFRNSKNAEVLLQKLKTQEHQYVKIIKVKSWFIVSVEQHTTKKEAYKRRKTLIKDFKILLVEKYKNFANL